MKNHGWAYASRLEFEHQGSDLDWGDVDDEEGEEIISHNAKAYYLGHKY